jgi:hypothetical protein
MRHLWQGVRKFWVSCIWTKHPQGRTAVSRPLKEEQETDRKTCRLAILDCEGRGTDVWRKISNWTECVSFIIIFIIIILPLVTGHFFPALLLNQRLSPPLRLPASDCSTAPIMCDVPSTAVFSSESTECFPGVASIFFSRPLVTIPVAPVTTGIVIHFMLHTRCVSVHKPVYFNLFSASFAWHFCPLVLPRLSVSMF